MIHRRDFLKIAGAVVPYWGLIPIANAQSSLYAGKILINIHADGGMDASSWADPRERDPLMNNYAAAGTPAGVAGNIRFAPMGNNAVFFTRYAPQMLVINGVNSETNSHEDGTRAHATGVLAMGYPNLSELFASVQGKGLPLPWLNAGGFMTSAGLVPATPMPNGNTFVQLISPNASSATNDFLKAADVQKVLATRTDRLTAQKAAGDLIPRSQLVNAQFNAAAESRALLARVAQFIPPTFDNAAHVGLVAAQAGVTTTLQFSSGGFDGHGQLANSYAQSLPRLTDLVDYIWTKSATLNLSSRIMVRIYSEFGRTPLNNGNGKDHWSVGTQVLMEAAPTWGNRVFGASGPKHEQLKINPATGAVDPTNGMIIKPRNIHDALRKYLGIQTTDPRFALKVPATENFDFFNPALNTGYPNL
jgi:uncharacterized protein (DUF1501 family)